MIKVHIVRDKEGFIWEFTVEGHAGAARTGRDIVCAAVSAIAYTGLGALQELAGIENYVERDGYIKCNIPSDIAQEKKPMVKIILDTMAIGLKQIRYTPSYKRYISILDEEV